MYQQCNYVTKNKEKYFEINTFQVSSPLSLPFAFFKHLKLPISIKIIVTMKHLFIY